MSVDLKCAYCNNHLADLNFQDLLHLKHMIESEIKNRSDKEPLTEAERNCSFLESIRLVRERLGFGLLQAKNYCELHRAERYSGPK